MSGQGGPPYHRGSSTYPEEYPPRDGRYGDQGRGQNSWYGRDPRYTGEYTGGYEPQRNILEKLEDTNKLIERVAESIKGLNARVIKLEEQMKKLEGEVGTLTSTQQSLSSTILDINNRVTAISK